MLHRLLTIGDKLQVVEKVQCRVVKGLPCNDLHTRFALGCELPSVGLLASLRCAPDILDQDLISRLGPPYQKVLSRPSHAE
jgi:hypothetical protein